MAFGHDTTTNEILEGIDLSGKTALVTGASGGLGAETARALASRGATVTLAVRDVPKGEQVAQTIRESTGSEIDVVALELDSPPSVRACAEKWLASHGVLNLLINNAGVMACPLARTGEGWEIQFATNHLGHFLLTMSLLPALRDGAPARIVNLSSGAHRFGGIDFDDIHFNDREYNKFAAYGQSKTANVLFAVELGRRLAGSGVTINAVHPGVIMTDLGRHLTPEDLAGFPGATSVEDMIFKTVESGAATSVWAATSPELEGRSGLYLEDCGVASPATEDGVQVGYSSWAMDPEAAARLFELSEQLVGL
ncbi:MAG: SDR family NAD(P)-dependent oxidoreductase [Gammaproteobacteria bacterium]|nr:SDR family NAD(P)-dependent oxidoreductase [Gammaproteobacteria bacterium]